MISADLFWLRDDPVFVANTLAATLSTAEQQELAGFKNAERQRNFLLSRALLRKTLAPYLQKPENEIHFHRATSGRLLLAEDSRWQFSLSHAAGFIAVIVAEVPCGVDIEVAHHIAVEKIARRYFAPAEIHWLEHCDVTARPREFFRLWTLKEASVKALGEGLAHNLGRLAFDISTDPPRLLDTALHLQCWQCSEKEFFLAGVVVTTEKVQWTVRELNLAELQTS